MPPVPASSTSKDADPKQPPPPVANSWERIDSTVLQWIYGTISTDLLSTILKKNTTAYAAWKALDDIFTDNKASRAIHLKNKFATTRLDNFPNMSAYCQELKVLADQLANVDAPVADDNLVLQLITGLNEQYEGIGMLLQNTHPLPSFYAAHSSVIREETRQSVQASRAAARAGTTLHATTNKSDDNSRTTSDYQTGHLERARGRGRRRKFVGRGR
ncbi:uncharacterized protein LOC143552421, partial [Bidens hawaiensis]|uniref:uncharacterized protein LOC143552421 n=1 Tax=Bidens hawaiensis TaxID=980011 RepID=UPI00404B22B0